MQVGQSTRGQRGAAGSKLQEGFPLVRRHSTQNSDKAQEAGTETANREDRSAGQDTSTTLASRRHVHNVSFTISVRKCGLEQNPAVRISLLISCLILTIFSTFG